MAREYDKKNPVFAKAQMGVATNHSSGQRSVPEYPDAQSDDDINDVPVKLDPNISGNAPTQDCYTWLAGKLDGWKENDDYRTFFENSVGCDGMLACDSCDGDYDDNGGYPTAIGHSRGDHAPAGDDVSAEYSAGSFPISPIYVRRV
jgi:hypothetical protein